MVKRIILISLILLSLSGCGEVMVKHDVVEKDVPVMYVPKPPETVRPELNVKKLTPDDRRKIGVISKAYADDMQVVADYVGILETIINKYKELAASNPDIAKMTPEEQTKVQQVENYFKNLGSDANKKD